MEWNSLRGEGASFLPHRQRLQSHLLNQEKCDRTASLQISCLYVSQESQQKTPGNERTDLGNNLPVL